jgi:hypothetical protein
MENKQKLTEFILHEEIKGNSSIYCLRIKKENSLSGMYLDNIDFKNKTFAICKNRCEQPLNWMNPERIITNEHSILPLKSIEKDRGTIETGITDKDHAELFINGKILQGKFIIKQLNSSKNDNNKTTFMIRPKNQSPEILSEKLNTKLLDPDTIKPMMPVEWQNKIPAELSFWTKKSSREVIENKLIEIRRIFKKRGLLSKEEQLDFIFASHGFKYNLMFSNGLSLRFYTDIRKNSSVEAHMINKKWNERPIAHIDRGQAKITNNGKNKIIKFSGLFLKSEWELILDKNSYTLQKISKEPNKLKTLKTTKISNNQISHIKLLSEQTTLSLSQIADIIGCSKSTIVQHQRKQGLR